MFSSALIGSFTVPLISNKETQGGKYIFKYLQLYRRVIIMYIKHRHQGAVINTRGIETAFERSVVRVMVSLSRDTMHKLCLYYGATVLTTHFTRSDAYQWCSGSVNHSPSSSSLITLFMCSAAFKQARVTPLLKIPTLNTSLIENYRPVSLLPFIAKTHFIRTLYLLSVPF